MGQDAGAADGALAVPVGGNAFPYLRGFNALFPSPQGILGRSHAEDEGVWSEHPHNVSVLTPIPGICAYSLKAAGDVVAPGDVCWYLPWQKMSFLSCQPL